MKTNRILLTLFYALLGSVIAGIIGGGSGLFVLGGAIFGQILSYFNVGTGTLAFLLPPTLKEAREKRATIEAELKSWDENIKKENPKKEMTKEELEKWDRMINDSIDLKQHIIRLEQTEEILKDQSLAIEKLKDKLKGKTDKSDINKTFVKYLRFGMHALNQEERELMVTLDVNGEELRAQGVGTDSAGGYLVPEGFSNQLERALLAYNSVLQACTIVTTASGNDLPWPSVNDTTNEGVLVTENPVSAISEQDVTFGGITLKAYAFSSYIVKASIQLLQDSYFDIESLLASLLGERLGRVLATYFTTGSGSSQPNGIVTAATDSGVIPSATAITRNNIVDVMYCVNADYKARGAFMIADATEKAIRKLSFGTSDDRPLWQAAIKEGLPDTIEGKPYFVNNKMSGPGASATSLLFGDLKKYLVRKVKGETLVVFREKYMDQLQVGFMAYCRYDGNLLDAGTHPVVKLVHPAS